LRFEVRYPGGAVHEVALESAVAVVGRDPSCDLVINDPKCSRRHAVVESGPGGLVIRDSGSANGILVNGRRTERAPLAAGDVFRIGDVEVAVVEVVEAGTLVMDPLTDPASQPPHLRTATLPPLEHAPDDTTGSLTPARVPAVAAPPPPPAPPAPAPRTPARPRSLPPQAPRAAALDALRPPRPLTISVLSVLWVLSIPFHALIAIVLAQGMPGATGITVAVAGAVLALAGGLMSFGLWTGQGWARPAQIALAGLGILNCPFALASVATLVYMLRAPARRYFLREAPDPADQSEAVFAAAIVAAVVLGGLVTAGLTFVARTARAPAAMETAMMMI
jgi:hypothetical protein